MRDDAEEVQRLGMARRGIEDLPAQRLGGLKTSCLAMLLGERESLGERKLLRRGAARRRADVGHA
ncbi:MAG: hypothetical protein JO357_04285 [Hyphomicrobiales bacterium]|nr:hypothetical protein [Hyphomicrobiales bacterium]